MSKNDLIECFNKQECIYKACGMFEQTLDICGIEHLKKLKITQVGEEVNPLRYQPAPAQKQQNPPPQGMTAGISWMIKGNQDATPDSPMAYTFVHKYDAAKKIATDEIKADVVELVTYLVENKRYTDGIYDYTLSKDGNFLNRYIHKGK